MTDVDNRNENVKLIDKFYHGFQKKDVQNMLACYSGEVRFNDPIFQDLVGKEANAMWMMLIEKGGDLEINYHSIHADENQGSAEWQATYTFTKTGRKIVNKISARFTIQNGKIISHKDDFSLWRWTQQAFGWTGLFMGWTKKMQEAIRAESKKGLQMYIKRKRL